MRRLLVLALAVPVLTLTAGAPAFAQVSNQQDRALEDQMRRQERSAPRRLADQANAGPCPYVKILYDAARYVELVGPQVSASAASYTGEIEGLTADCNYRDDEPIVVDMDILFQLGRGPRGESDQRTYRYWIAVTERNSAILTKEYFDLPVSFDGADRTMVTEEIRGLTIPRATTAISGSNFEILVGFDVTPEMAEFNRSGSRFRINAGQSQSQ